MSKTKIEIIFIENSDSEMGFTLLGEFSIDSEGTPAPLIIGAIGEFQGVDLPGKRFTGKIVNKLISYSQKDMAGKTWDLVTHITITLELTSGGPDPLYAEINKG